MQHFDHIAPMLESVFYALSIIILLKQNWPLL